MKKKPLGMDALMGRTSERIYSKKYCIEKIRDNLSPYFEESIAKNLPIDMLYDFKIHFKVNLELDIVVKVITDKDILDQPNHCLSKICNEFCNLPDK